MRHPHSFFFQIFCGRGLDRLDVICYIKALDKNLPVRRFTKGGKNERFCNCRDVVFIFRVNLEPDWTGSFRRDEHLRRNAVYNTVNNNTKKKMRADPARR